ncbi:hypothetical protein THAOC_20846 [Thalassiosira oceanica]|uniref:Uncharacterized protein n=1 Tax=Thalassiosira oceanica TaxID=159749 RepID=K0S2C9_THAOC|nr:hypothetical protein THAOC_20846 [Thalassiosira oceanica]|eukprot:EJK58989.1 hypothetical protein THAOC_20846 [Thalassiosira oceanica]
MNTSDDEDDSSLSSVETDVDLLLQDVIEKAANQTDDEPLEGQWKFLSQSRRGGEMAGNLKSGVFDDTLKVSYDSVNEVLKDKMLVEVRHSLEQVRKKLKMQNRTPIDAVNGMSPELREEVACKRREPLSEIERRSTEEKQRHKIGSCIQLSGGIE